MISLPNGCYCSDLTVFPKNWNTKKASLAKDWYIHYRFYDPKFPKPKQRIIKGMNQFKSLSERQQAVRSFLQDEIYMLQTRAFNPITGELSEETPLDHGEIHPDMPFIAALEKAIDLMEVEHNAKIDLRSVLKYFGKAAALVRKDHIPLQEIKRKDIRLILNNCEKVKDPKKGKWSDNQFNHYRAHISMIYSYLNREEIVEYNPVDKIEKKSVVKSPRNVLSQEQRILIDQHLLRKAPEFHRYVHIFFHSGARRAELLRVKGSDVDLVAQKYRVLVKKRKNWVWIWKTIKDVALPYWTEAMKRCLPDDYLFSEGLEPGSRQIRPEQITRRWRRHVKEPQGKISGTGGLGINIDFYSLKHLHTTEVLDYIQADPGTIDPEKAIAEHNSHTSKAMVVSIYDVKQKERQHRKIKEINNPFA
jgi:integrase